MTPQNSLVSGVNPQNLRSYPSNSVTPAKFEQSRESFFIFSLPRELLFLLPTRPPLSSISVAGRMDVHVPSPPSATPSPACNTGGDARVVDRLAKPACALEKSGIITTFHDASFVTGHPLMAPAKGKRRCRPMMVFLPSRLVFWAERAQCLL